MSRLPKIPRVEDDRDRLRRLSTEFRLAILQSGSAFPDFLRKRLQSFPKDACGHASILLGLYLRESGFADVEYVVGIRQHGESHAWLQIENTIIDITADQFPEVSDSVIVTEDHSWHSEFQLQQRYPADLETYSKGAKRNYTAAYNETKKHLPPAR